MQINFSFVFLCSCHLFQVSQIKVTQGIPDSEKKFTRVLPIVTKPFSPPGSDPLPQAYIMANLQFQCSVSAVGKNTFLTAAHCLYQKEVEPYWVKDNNGKLLKPSRIFVHTDYTNSKEHLNHVAQKNDLGLIVVSEPHGLDPYKVSLESLKKGDPIEIAGYGIRFLKPSAFELTKEVLHGTNVIADLKDGFIIIKGRVIFDETLQGTESVASTNDSGGPLFFEDKIVGIASGSDSRQKSYASSLTPAEMMATSSHAALAESRNRLFLECLGADGLEIQGVEQNQKIDKKTCPVFENSGH